MMVYKLDLNNALKSFPGTPMDFIIHSHLPIYSHNYTPIHNLCHVKRCSVSCSRTQRYTENEKVLNCQLVLNNVNLFSTTVIKKKIHQYVSLHFWVVVQLFGSCSRSSTVYFCTLTTTGFKFQLNFALFVWESTAEQLCDVSADTSKGEWAHFSGAEVSLVCVCVGAHLTSVKLAAGKTALLWHGCERLTVWGPWGLAEGQRPRRAAAEASLRRRSSSSRISCSLTALCLCVCLSGRLPRPKRPAGIYWVKQSPSLTPFNVTQLYLLSHLSHIIKQLPV